MKLYFASQNKHKIHEIAHRLASINASLEVLGLQDLGHYQDLEESQNTFEGNALQKAAFIWHNYQVDCFADDSGLEVEALDMAPGIFSARYAGEQKNHADNIALLLKNMEGKNNRNAHFRTCIVLILEGETHYFEGIISGKIIEKPQGNGGFGYDPIFVPNGHERTFAEMSLDEKNHMSHRSQAVSKLVEFIKQRI